MYAKIFKSLWDGSLRGRSDAILVFVNLLTHADLEGYVDRHFRAISDETGLSEDRVRKSIEELESKDESSRSPELDGRRLERLDEHRDWGWRIVNFKHYRDLQTEAIRREQNRLRQARFRDKSRPTPSPAPPSPKAEATKEAEVEAEKNVRNVTITAVTQSNAKQRPTSSTTPPNPFPSKLVEAKTENGEIINHPDLATCQAHFKPSKFTTAQVKKAFLTFEASKDPGGNWFWGKRMVGDWRAAMESRMNDELDRNPEQSVARNPDGNSFADIIRNA